MKKALSILVAFSIIAQGMVNLGLCAYYELNKKMIAEKLCINKDNPQLHCNGQCYLAKQFKKAAENEKRQNQSLREKDEVISLYNDRFEIVFIPSFSFTGFMGHYDDGTLNAPHTTPDQPPQVLA